MENESNEIACDVTIKALSFKTRKCLSNLLNPVKIIPTDKGLPRYFVPLEKEKLL